MKIEDISYWPQNDRVDDDLLATLWRSSDIKLVEALYEEPRGMVLCDSAEESARMIALMLDFFSRCSIAVIAKSKKAAKGLRERIKKYTDRVPESYSNRVGRAVPKILIHYPEIVPDLSLDDFQVIIFADAESALVSRTHKWNIWRRSQLLYCVLPVNREYDEYELYRIEKVFGDVICTAVDYIPNYSTVEVYQVGPFNYPAGDTTDPLKRKRRFIWQNHSRNQAIADIVNAIGNLDMRTLKRYGILLDQPDDFLTQWYRELEREISVVVLVEFMEHGRALRRLLEGCQIVSGVGDASSRCGSGDTSIVTAVRAVDGDWEVDDWLDADIVIRVDGSAGSYTDSFFPYVHWQGERKLMIDIADDFDAPAIQDTDSRLSAYLDRGCSVGSAPGGR